MTHNSNEKRAFCVVQFIELPFEGIDDYVCVPSTWLIVRRAMDEKAVVAYPRNEDPFDTRDRAERKERFNDEWKRYMAAVKYESDTYRDAEYWIATRNDYGPLVEEESEITSTQSRFTLNNELRSVNRRNSSKSNDNPQKPLPKISIKQPALSDSTKPLNRKLLKLSEAGPSSRDVVYDIDVETRRSTKKEPIIIQDNQPLECDKTKITAAASNDKSSSSHSTDGNHFKLLSIREQQELSMLPMDVDTPTLVIDTDRESQANSNMEKQLPSNEVLRQFAKHPKPPQGPQMSVAPSMEMISNDRKTHTDDAQTPLNLMDQTGSLPSRSVEQLSVVTENRLHDGQQVLEMQTQNSRYQIAQLQSTLISSQGIQHVLTINIERSNDVAPVDPRNVLQSVTNAAATSQNLPGSSHMHPSFAQSLDRHQNSLAHEQEPLRGSTGSKNYDHRPNFPTVGTRIPFIGRNSTQTSNRNFELPQQRQLQPNQENLQQQPQRPTIRIGISIKPKNNRQISTLQRVTKETPQPIITKVLNSIREALSTSQNTCLLDEQQLQASRSESVLVSESHREVMDNSCQTDDCMVEETPPPYYAVTSDSDYITDHEVISGHEMSADESPFETSNNSYYSGIASADRPKAIQNHTSTNNQTHPRAFLEKQMLDNFASLTTQMGSTLRYTCDMYNNLRESIHETAKTYRSLLDAVDRFNTVQISASNAFISSNLTPQVPLTTQERHIEATATTNLNNKGRHSHDVANRAPKNQHNNL